MNKNSNRTIVFSYDLDTGDLDLDVGCEFESISLFEDNEGLKLRIKPKDLPEINLDMANDDSPDDFTELQKMIEQSRKQVN